MGRSLSKFVAFIMLTLSIFVLVSCENNVSSESEQLVSISFSDDSKALIAKLPEFEKAAYYWKYAARKSLDDTNNMLDGSGLKSGETASYSEEGAVFVADGNTAGLDAKIPGFSQGLWDFMIFGYTRSGAGTETSPYTYSLIYKGEAKAQSLRKDYNAVEITVSPVTDKGKGTLLVDTDNIVLTPVQTDTTNVSTEFTKKITVNGSLWEGKTSDSVEPGSYVVKVQIVKSIGSTEYVFAEGSVKATVYSNLKTTVSGSLNELLTYTEFDASSSYPGMPTGTLSAVQNETTKEWTVTFTNTNTSSVPTSFQWFVDGVLQSGESSSTYKYVPGLESVNIMCVFSNTSGTGSASVFIK